MVAALKIHASLKSSKMTLVALSVLAVMTTLYIYDDPTYNITDRFSSRILGRRGRAKRTAYLEQPRRELIWVMSHPLAGSDDIINMVERATLTSMGTNYGNIVQTRDMEHIVNTRESTLLQKRWYGSGPFQNNVDFDLPAEYGDVLVKTYCTGHCLTEDGSCGRIPYSRNLVSVDKFWDSCAGGTQYITGRKPHVKRAKPYWRNQVKKVIVVVRSPFNMVMARYREHLNDNDKEMSTHSFDSYCQTIDNFYMKKNKEVKTALKRDQRIKPLVDGVKCVTEFWRIGMWYQQAFAIAQRRNPLIIRHEEYVVDPQRTLNTVLNYSGMKQTNTNDLPIFTEDTVLYFNNEEKEKVGALFEAVVRSDSDTWTSFKHYFMVNRNNDYLNQKGNVMNNEATNRYKGGSVDLSSDGDTMAVRAYHNSENDSHVRIYEWANSVWYQKGEDIYGGNYYFDYGSSTTMSYDGNTVAVGVYGKIDGKKSNSHVCVYKWDGWKWSQKGEGLDEEVMNHGSGLSIAMSSDGDIVAVGTQASSDYTGHVRVYQWESTKWSQKGDDIEGEARYDISGFSVVMSSNGKTIAVGSVYSDGGGDRSGHVRIYVWEDWKWSQKGVDLDGEAADDQSGWSVAMSSDGKTVAVGARLNDGSGIDSGHVRIYKWEDWKWSQKGEDLNGEAAHDYSGYSIAMSSDGDTIAVGAGGNDGGGTDSGHVHIYKWDNSKWDLKGEINGEAAGDYFGMRIALASDGKTLVSGAAAYNKENGYVRVYEVNE